MTGKLPVHGADIVFGGDRLWKVQIVMRLIKSPIIFVDLPYVEGDVGSPKPLL